MLSGVSSGKKAVVEDRYQSRGMRSQAVRGLAWCHPGSEGKGLVDELNSVFNFFFFGALVT